MAPLKGRLAIGGSCCPTTIDQIAAVKHMGVRPRTLNSRTLRYDAPAPLSEGIQEALSGLGEPAAPARTDQARSGPADKRRRAVNTRPKRNICPGSERTAAVRASYPSASR